MGLKTNWCVLLLTLISSSFNGVASGLAKGRYTRQSDSRDAPISAICNVAIPSLVETDPDVWNHKQTPAEDELDRYLTSRTGRQYWSGKFADWLDLPEVCFEGAVYEWRAAVRARDHASIMVAWGEDDGYSLFIGELENTVNNVFQRSQWLKLWESFTPGILSVERYVPFYLRLEPGKLIFGTECDGRPVFTHNVTISRGDRVRLGFQSFSRFGGKLLYTAPISNRGAPFTSICGVTVPPAVQVQVDDTCWKHFETPTEDALDRYMVKETECKYWAGGARNEFHQPEESFNGKLYEWRGAIRTGETPVLKIEWGFHKGFEFRIGDFFNATTTVEDLSTNDYPPHQRTNGILHTDRYVGLYLRLEPETLVFKTECDELMNFNFNVTVAAGDPVKLTIYSIWFKGGKYLHSCPALIEDGLCS